MINQVPNFNQSPFNDLSLNSKGKNFFVEKKYLPAEEKEKEKNPNTLIFTIAASALVAGFSVLALMRGPKGANKALNKVKNVLEKKITRTKDTGKMNKFTELYIAALSKVNSFIEKTESINNFTSLKDAGFKKFMDKKKWSSKIHRKITKWFEKVSRETVVTSWHNTKHKMNKTFKHFEDFDTKILAQNSEKSVTINGVTKKTSEWAQILKNDRNAIKTIIDENTSQNKFVTRYKKIKTATQNLADVTWNSFKDWKNPDLYQTFVADRMILRDKAAMLDEMNLFRKAVSYTRDDRLEMARKLVKRAETLTDSKDFGTIKKISQLKSDLKNGISNEKLITRIDDLRKSLGSSKNEMNPKTLAGELLEKARGILQENSEGKVQEMLAIYEKLLPPKDYAKIRKETNAFIKALDDSINIESEQFFDKVRDLQIGSAPTDVLSMLASGALIGAGLLRADNRDERISVTLKAGIPVIGALATSLYCTARLVSGGKAMGVGLASGWILNKIGEQTDKFRKKLQERHNAQAGTNAL